LLSELIESGPVAEIGLISAGVSEATWFIPVQSHCRGYRKDHVTTHPH